MPSPFQTAFQRATRWGWRGPALIALAAATLAAGCRKEAPGTGIAASESFAMAMPETAGYAMRIGARGAASSVVGRVGGGAGAGGSQPRGAETADPISHLAYAYALSLELPGDRLAGLMDAHTAACRDAGLRVCQLVSSRRDGDGRDARAGTLSIRAEPQWLQSFMRRAQGDTLGAAGRVAAQSTTTDDLTREIVDTEAMLRARTALRDRLQQLLATRPGSLSDLLGVERELSRVQGEIDSTASSLTAARTRVAMSALTIEYRASAAGMSGGRLEPVWMALAGFLVAVVESTAALVTFLGALLPWAVTVAFVVWLLIRWRRRRRLAATSATPSAPR